MIRAYLSSFLVFVLLFCGSPHARALEILNVPFKYSSEVGSALDNAFASSGRPVPKAKRIYTSTGFRTAQGNFWALGLLSGDSLQRVGLEIGQCDIALYDPALKTASIVVRAGYDRLEDTDSCEGYRTPIIFDLNQDKRADLIYMASRPTGVYEVYLYSGEHQVLCFSDTASSAVSDLNIRLEKLSAKKRSLALRRIASSSLACTNQMRGER